MNKTVDYQEHLDEIKKYEDMLNITLPKLKQFKVGFMTKSIHLNVAESYIEKLKKQIIELKNKPVLLGKNVKLNSNSSELLEKLKLSLELNDIDVNKITELYIREKNYT